MGKTKSSIVDGRPARRIRRKKDKGRSKRKEQRATCTRDRWRLSIGKINQWRHAGDALFPGREGILIFLESKTLLIRLGVTKLRERERERERVHVPQKAVFAGQWERRTRAAKGKTRNAWFSQLEMRHFTRLGILIRRHVRSHLNWDLVTLSGC